MTFGESMATDVKAKTPSGIVIDLSEVEVELIGLFRRRIERLRVLPTKWEFKVLYTRDSSTADFIDREEVRICRTSSKEKGKE